MRWVSCRKAQSGHVNGGDGKLGERPTGSKCPPPPQGGRWQPSHDINSGSPVLLHSRADPALANGSSLSFPSEISHSPLPFHPPPPSPQPWCLIHLNKYFRGCDLPLGSTCFQESPAERVTLDPCSGVKVPFTWGRKRRGADLPESSSSPSSVPASPGSSPGSA